MRYLETPQGLTLSTRSVFPAMSKARGANDHQAMPIYLIEVHMADASELELERAVRMLDAAIDPDAGVDDRDAHDRCRPQS